MTSIKLLPEAAASTGLMNGPTLYTQSLSRATFCPRVYLLGQFEALVSLLLASSLSFNSLHHISLRRWSIHAWRCTGTSDPLQRTAYQIRTP